MKIKKEENGNIICTQNNSKGDKIEYTIMDMGEYVGHSRREFWQKAPECLKTMQIESKEMKAIFLVDEQGNYIKSSVTLPDGTQRITIYSGIKEENSRYTAYGYARDEIVVPSKDKDSLLRMLNAKTYSYDSKTGKYLTEDGSEYSEKNILAEENLPESLLARGEKIAQQYEQERANFKEEDDVLLDK